MSGNGGEQARLTVLGSGSWGATLAAHLHGLGHAVTLWCPFEEELRKLRAAGHPPGVPELQLPDVTLTADLESATRGVDGVVLVIPAQAVSDVCARLASPPPLTVIASKGIDLRTLQPLSDVVEKAWPSSRVAVVSGPCIAREVARGVPTSVVAACADEDSAHRVQTWFSSGTFRVYRQDDVLGVEFSGAYKNVIAIAAGIGDGLGFGANSKSALITRGIVEMRRFVEAMGGSEQTVAGLAGLGDLCVTCFSPHSRNRRFGEAVGKGELPNDALASIGETVEGVPTARAVLALGERTRIALPIAEAVVRILDGEWTPLEAVQKLMTRELKEEFL